MCTSHVGLSKAEIVSLLTSLPALTARTQNLESKNQSRRGYIIFRLYDPENMVSKRDEIAGWSWLAVHVPSVGLPLISENSRCLSELRLQSSDAATI